MLLLCSTPYQLETSPPQWPIVLVAGIAGTQIMIICERTFMYDSFSLPFDVTYLFYWSSFRFSWLNDWLVAWCNISIHRYVKLWKAVSLNVQVLHKVMNTRRGIFDACRVRQKQNFLRVREFWPFFPCQGILSWQLIFFPKRIKFLCLYTFSKSLFVAWLCLAYRAAHTFFKVIHCFYMICIVFHI